RGGNPFANIARDIEGARGRMEAAFLDFYPQLQAFSRQRIHALRDDRRGPYCNVTQKSLV
ncbi:MAG: hypothetical protein KDI09_16795, partial [Halioglobus sp.]|nr:hypothetical protein [Halioglobus sp.]